MESPNRSVYDTRRDKFQSIYLAQVKKPTFLHYQNKQWLSILQSFMTRYNFLQLWTSPVFNIFHFLSFVISYLHLSIQASLSLICIFAYTAILHHQHLASAVPCIRTILHPQHPYCLVVVHNMHGVRPENNEDVSSISFNHFQLHWFIFCYIFW